MDDDDEVQILPMDQRPISCEICHISLRELSLHKRQEHYDQHFSEQANKPSAGPPEVIDLSGSSDTVRGGSSFLGSSKLLAKKKAEKSKLPPPAKQNVFWHPSQDSPPPSNFTPGLIPVLRHALLKSHAKGQTVRAGLCYEGMVHVGTETWDLGWGCGYRNFLMACTALMDQQVQPLYFPALDHPTPPGVRNLQQWIEDAWRAGFDKEGADELKKKLVGTKKWIGTAEVHVAFLSRGIPSRLVDFSNTENSGTDTVLRWIEAYFSEAGQDSREMRLKAKVKATVGEALRGASPVVVTERMPLILQHKGHSRTIVGYERTKDGSINLLCFDPSRRPTSIIRNTAIAQLCFPRPGRGSKNHSTEEKRHHSMSPAKFINSFLHPRSHKERDSTSSSSPGSSRKRHAEEDVGTGPRDLKRVRGGLLAPTGAAAIKGKEVIEILDDDEMEVDEMQRATKSNAKAVPTDGNYAKALEFFRLKPKKVAKNDRYQILYFPLEDILSEQERWKRRVVTAEIIHGT